MSLYAYHYIRYVDIKRLFLDSSIYIHSLFPETPLSSLVLFVFKPDDVYAQTNIRQGCGRGARLCDTANGITPLGNRTTRGLGGSLVGPSCADDRIIACEIKKKMLAWALM